MHVYNVHVGVYGHSAVYDASTNSILVFGGYMYTRPQAEVSSSLYALSMDTLIWRRVQLADEVCVHVGKEEERERDRKETESEREERDGESERERKERKREREMFYFPFLRYHLGCSTRWLSLATFW